MNAIKTVTDFDLLQQLKVNDREAFKELYNRHWLSLFNVAHKRLNDSESCKDVVHDIFADLWEKRSTRDIRDILPYLHTAVRNKVFTLLSKGQASAHFVEPFENMAESAFTTDGPYNKKELQHLIALLMETLPAKRREIFRLKYFEDLSTNEISEVLCITQKTVQNQLLLAAENLRASMGHYLTIILLYHLGR